MRLGKIAQLRGKPLEDGFRVEYGIDIPKNRVADFNFATLSIIGIRVGTPICTYYGSCALIKKEDVFRDFLLSGLDEKEIRKEDIEENLLVIIPYSSKIETTAKQIAGRYPEEAILLMHVGDTVKVKKAGAKSETYMAVQAGNEIFLVKKNR